jgi:hypothetical protein
MAWSMKGRFFDLCSCAMPCRCSFGPAEPDRGWCSGGILLDIRQGHSDGVSLNGRKVGWIVDLPKDYATGNGTCRLYVDDGASADQRRELEVIGQGQRGGAFAVLASIVTTWLPTLTTPIVVRWDEQLSAEIGDFALIRLAPMKDGNGRQTKLVHAPSESALGIEQSDLAFSTGSEWNDPERRRWQAGGYGSIADFDWKG